jgi:Domain of unknown function (DUF222)/HNH endonuclease
MCRAGLSPGRFTSLGEALAAVEAGLAFVAREASPAAPIEELADSLRALERAESAQIAARSGVLSAFVAQAGPEADGHASARGWLSWQTRITRGAAAGAIGWMRRLSAHRPVADALASSEISASWARHICDWSDRLPEDRRGDADQILLAAAAGGADLADLSGLAEEMFRRSAPPDSDADDGKGFTDRSLRLDLHYRGAGKLAGELTGECAAALTAVLESLGKKAGPEDDRTQPQRDHDALEEALRRLVAEGCLPDRAGQPTQIQLLMTLDQLRSLDGTDRAEAAWAEAAWAAGRAAGDGEPGWLSDRATAAAYACDAQVTPMVTGHVDPAALTRMTADYLASLGPDRPGGTSGALPPRTLRRLQDILLRHAADVLSGPTGLAAFLRTGVLASEFPPAMSLALDVGTATSVIPPHLRRSTIRRDRHCAFPGCRQRPAACQVHHIVPRSKGGATALTNLLLLCTFHHLIAVHRWGWTIALNGDGTTTANSPDRTRTLHSHGPPAAAAA